MLNNNYERRIARIIYIAAIRAWNNCIILKSVYVYESQDCRAGVVNYLCVIKY